MKHFQTIILCAAVLLSTTITAGCTSRPNNTNTLTVTASFYPLYYFATQIGGEYATVYNLTPVGTEPHEYEPTSTDLIQLVQSDVVLLNGGQLEPWADDVLAQLNDDTLVVRTGEASIDASNDPHVWLNPVLAKQQVTAITNSFIRVDPDNTEQYNKNAQTLLQELDALDEQYRTGLAQCASRDIITTHTAFNYLALEYNLHQVALAGLSPEAEPSPTTLAEVAQFAREHNVKYIFFETLVSPKLAETIAEEVGAQTLILDPLEGVAPADQAHGQNYQTIMQANLANLRTALQCQ